MDKRLTTVYKTRVEKSNDFSSLKDTGLAKERRMGMSAFYAEGNKSRWRKRIFRFGDYTYKHSGLTYTPGW